jgi:hypothetical protein
MAYTPHVLVSFGGSWTTDPKEVWECGIRVTADGGGGVTVDCDAYLADIEAPLSTWFHDAGNGMMSTALLEWVKANHIGADGKYVDTTLTHVFDYSAPVAGAVGMKGPGYCTLVYSWVTAAKRGRAHMGRIYPPNASYPLISAFQVDSGSASAAALSGKGLIAILANASGAAGTKPVPSVTSKIDGSIRPITGCRVDTIYDVQRRRKNRVTGTSVSLAPIP